MDNHTDQLVLNLILFVILPLWGLSGLWDWWCHKKSNIEATSGVKEAKIHCLMGIQIGIPVTLGIFFNLSVLVYLIMFACLVVHELVAHWDVKFAQPRREISIWEMQAHSYLATVPFYIFCLISVLGWDVVLRTVQFDWAGSMNFVLRDEPVGGQNYYFAYAVFITIVCGFPYISELLRCWRYERKLQDNVTS